MERKIIHVQAEVDNHTKPILEHNQADVFGYLTTDTIEESKYHSNGNYHNIDIIGEFSIPESEVFSEALISNNISYKNKSLNYQIQVYDGEGPTPHFHIVRKPIKKADVCICIYEPRYFDHGTYTGTLNASELKVLDNFLRTCPPALDITYWDVINLSWRRLNPENCLLYPNVLSTNVQPDYTNMKGFKSGR